MKKMFKSSSSSKTKDKDDLSTSSKDSEEGIHAEAGIGGFGIKGGIGISGTGKGGKTEEKAAEAHQHHAGIKIGGGLPSLSGGISLGGSGGGKTEGNAGIKVGMDGAAENIVRSANANARTTANEGAELNTGSLKVGVSVDSGLEKSAEEATAKLRGTAAALDRAAKEANRLANTEVEVSGNLNSSSKLSASTPGLSVEVKKPTAVKAGGDGSISMSATTNGSVEFGDRGSSPNKYSLRMTEKYGSTSALDDKNRPMSPTTRLIALTRIDEKNQLVTLNDRLAVILSRNRQLEAENTYLNSQLQDAKTKLTIITNELTRSFEEETARLQLSLEALGKEKLKIELALRKLQADYDELVLRLRKKDDEISSLLMKIRSLEAKITALNNELRAQDDDKNKLSREKMEISEQITKLEKDLENARKQYEAEAIAKIELEHALQNKGEEVQMKMHAHTQQFSEMLTIKTEDAANVGGQLRLEYEQRLAAAIAQLRADCDMQLQANREEQEGIYAKKEAALMGQLMRLEAQIKGQGGEFGNLQLRLSALERRIQELLGEKNALEANLHDMEAAWAGDKSSWASERMKLEGIIGELQLQMQQLLNEYQDLMEIKVALDNEISTYRTLVDGEEARLDMFLKEEEERMKRNLESQIEVDRTITISKPRSVTSYSYEVGPAGGGSGGGSGISVSGSGGAGTGVSVSGGGGSSGGLSLSASAGGKGVSYSTSGSGGTGGSTYSSYERRN